MTEIIKDSSTLYRVDFDEHCKVEIGDGISVKLNPQVCFSKWDDECWIKIAPVNSYTQNTPSEIGAGTIDKLEIISDDGKEAQHIYPCECDEKEEGAIEIEAVLTEKPKSGPAIAEWTFEDSGNLEYLKRDLSVLPLHRGAVTQDELGQYDDKGSPILTCPEEYVRSYRVNRTGTPQLLPVGQEKYKTGTVGSFKRPRVTDADSNLEWAELDIDTDTNTITVTCSQDFTDNATYPIKIDPTFGYTSVGVFSAAISDSIFGSSKSPANNGVATSMHLYVTGWSGGEKIKSRLYVNNGRAVEPSTTERTSGGSGWQTFQFAAADPAVRSADTLVTAFWADSSITYYNDVGVGTNSQYENSVTYATDWPREATLSNDTYEYSTYTTYETSTISAWRNLNISYAYHYPGSKNLDIDGSGFGASQGDGWARVGDAATYSGSSTFDTMTVNSWSNTQIDVTIPENMSNTLGQLWLYVKPNGGSANTNGFPVNVDTAWGKRFADYNSSTVNYTRSMGGTSPDVDNMTLQTVEIYVGGTHSSQVRVAVYQGGSLTDPVGATLVEDLGTTSGSGTEEWVTVTSSTNPSLTKNEVTWIVAKGNDSNYVISYGATSGGGDFQTARGRYNSTAIATSEATAYPSTWPADGGSFSSFWYDMYFTYDAASSGYPNDVHGVTSANIGEIDGTATASVVKVHGVNG